MSSGSSLLSHGVKIPAPLQYALVILFAAVIGYLLHRLGWLILPGSLLVPLLIGVVVAIYKMPKLGLFLPLILVTFDAFMGRHLPANPPYGFVTEVILVLTYILLFLKHFKYLNFQMAQRDIVLLMGIWMFYVVLELANPLAASRLAWFYTMRGVALLQLLVIPLVLILLNDKRGWKQFITLWLVLSLIAVLWGMKQKWIGVTAGEQQWLNEGAYKTHLLYGRIKLRVFSTLSDAGTFGAAMAHICIVTFILGLGPCSRKKKVLLFALAAMFFLGVLLSGTRGALIIPFTGMVTYLVMARSYKYLVIGAIIGTVVFSFLKFTHIGSGVYEIYRMRTALNPDDPSLQVRLRNRERLTEYLQDKPFGGGLGSTGRKGQQFSPGTWLANFPPDGLYTMIRAETGVVGKYIYLFIWIYILIKGMIITWRLPSAEYRNIGIALLAGYAGILAANYGNPVMTLFPNNLYTFISLGIVFSLKYWKENGEAELPHGSTPNEGALRPESYLRGDRTEN